MNPQASNRLAQLLAIVILLALGAGGVFWFFENFERNQREVRGETSPEVRRNPLLAAERYLTRLGFDVQSLSGRKWLTQLPAETGVLLVNQLGPSLPAEREQALLRWVANGGHLVFVVRRFWDEEAQTNGNSLLDRLGVRLQRVDLPDEDDAEQAQPGASIDLVSIDPEPDESATDRMSYKLSFRADRVLEDVDDDASWVLVGEQGPHLLEWSWGNGWITVLSDNELFSNEGIGEHDNAWFLSYLVAGEHKVWLLYSSNMPSLMALLWRSAPYLLLSAAVLLVLLIWSLTRRSGPRLARRTAVRRNLLEHLLAAAAYSWRTDQGATLFGASQMNVEQSWRKRHPLLERLDAQGRSRWIARKTGMDSASVEEALYGEAADEQALIRISAVQQELMNHLRRKTGR